MRRHEQNWGFLLGRLLWSSDEHSDLDEIYRDCAFVLNRLPGTNGKEFLNTLTSEGYQLTPKLPPLKITDGNADWSEEIVPSNMTATGFPARRFSTRIDKDASFMDAPLIGYSMPFHPSAAAPIRDFLGCRDFHGHNDARNGHLWIDVPDTRAAIVLEETRLSIRQTAADYCLVGQVGDQDPIKLTGEETALVDTANSTHLELWLLTQDNTIVDYRSSSIWPYRFAPNVKAGHLKEQLAETINQGETETCEFKPFIDLSDANKAPEIEKTVCALSNLKGGQLFVGVDDEGQVIGLAKGLQGLKKTRKPEVTRSHYIAEIGKRLRETLNDNQCFEIEPVELFGLHTMHYNRLTLV